MNSGDIRTTFLEFFKAREHTIVPSSSLVPQNDPSVLFTTAGMQQFKPYYIGKADPMKDFGAQNTASVQKCVRTSDIDEVGDESHLTFFEMLGNFSFGGYFKEKAIQDAYDFITKEMGLTIDYVTVFEGSDGVPADDESEKIWKGIDASIEVRRHGRADNFWGPTGEEGPCGPTTEIHVDGIEIWNIVFNQYYQEKDKTLRPLDIQGIDTGMGLERLALVSQFPKQVGEKAIFDTDLFAPILAEIPGDDIRLKRIIADHIRTAVFMIADGVIPGNVERGYVLRRVIRRAVRHADTLGAHIAKIVEVVSSLYKEMYPEVGNAAHIMQVLGEEEEKFRKTLSRGLKEFAKMSENSISGKEAFDLYQTYGFPIEMTEELAGERGATVDREAFEKELSLHQEKSRSGAEQKFKGGLAGHSDVEVRYHTATHLLNAALKHVLGDSVKQKGSNITTERLRFDFSYPEKLTDEQKKAVEDFVNEKISEGLPVVRKEMPKADAEALGAEMEFGGKYPDVVSVYFIGDPDNAISKEFCGGPHVENTNTLGTFKITKEESVAAGVRRIKATLS